MSLSSILAVRNSHLELGFGSLQLYGAPDVEDVLLVQGNALIDGDLACNNIHFSGQSVDSLSITGTTNTISTSTGALTVSGGVGIAKDVYIGGTLYGGHITGFDLTQPLPLTNTTNSVSIGTGALTVAGGVGITEDVNIGGNETVNGVLFITNGTPVSGTETGALLCSGGMNIAKEAQIGGIVKSLNTTDSVDTLIGSVVISGGVGIAKSVNIGGNENINGILHINNSTDNTGTNSGSLICEGGMNIMKNTKLNSGCDIAGILSVTNTTGSTAVGTGSVVISGGVSIAGNLNVGGSISPSGGLDPSVPIHITNTTNTVLPSVTPVVGSIITDGGEYIAKDLTVMGNIQSQNNVVIYDNGQSMSNISHLKITPSIDGGIKSCWYDSSGNAGLMQYFDGMYTRPQNTIFHGADSREAFLFESGKNGIPFDGNPLNNIPFSEITNTGIQIYSTTVSTSVLTGALRVAGGVGVQGGLNINDDGFFANDCTVNHNLTVNGTINGNVVGNSSVLRSAYPNPVISMTNDGITFSNMLVNNTSPTNRVVEFDAALKLDNTTQATNNITGSLIVGGGVGIAKDVFINGHITAGSGIPAPFDYTSIQTFTNTTQSTNTLTGALVVSGGMGIAKDLHIGGNITANSGIPAAFDYSALQVFTNPTDVDGGVHPPTGAVTISGGLGVAKTFMVDGEALFNGGSYFNLLSCFDNPWIAHRDVSQGALQVRQGGIGVFSDSTFGGELYCAATIDSTSVDTGTLLTAGGLGIAKSAHIGGNLYTGGSGTSSLQKITNGSVNTQLKSDSVNSISQLYSDHPFELWANGWKTMTLNNSGNSSIYPLSVTDTTQSTNSTTGSLKIAGGVGIVKDMYIGGTTNFTSLQGATGVPIAKFSSDDTFSDASLTSVQTSNSTVNYINSITGRGLTPMGNCYISGIQLTSTIGSTTFAISSGTWVYFNNLVVPATYQYITYGGLTSTVSPQIAAVQSRMNIYINNFGAWSYDYNTYIDVNKISSTYFYVGTLVAGGSPFVMTGVSNTTECSPCSQIQTYMAITEIAPFVRTFPSISDAGNSDLSLNIGSFIVSRPWMTVKAGTCDPQTTIAAINRPFWNMVYRATNGGALVSYQNLQTIARVSVPAVGYGVVSNLGGTTYAVYLLLYEPTSNLWFAPIPNLTFGTATDAASNARNLIKYPELRTCVLVGWYVIKDNSANFSALQQYPGAHLNYFCW